MATRDSLVFAAKIFDYLEVRKQELNEELISSFAKGGLDDTKSGEISSALGEISKFYEWLQEH